MPDPSAQHILIVGFGLSGVAVAKYMSKQGAKVTVTDMKQKSELMDSVNACADLKLFGPSDFLQVAQGVMITS